MDWMYLQIYLDVPSLALSAAIAGFRMWALRSCHLYWFKRSKVRGEMLMYRMLGA